MPSPRRSGPQAIARVALRVAGLAAALLSALVIWDVATYDERAWRADFDHLKRELAQRYANLDWMVSRRRIDLKTLDAETAAAIGNAHSRVFAALALRRFVRGFNDPHLRLVLADRSNAHTSSPTTAAAPPKPPPVASCDDAGYEQESYDFDFPFDRLAGWKRVRGGHFPAGLAGDLAVLRIASFGEIRYPDACRVAFQSGNDARTLQLHVRARLQSELTAAILDLTSRGAKRLLVDVTGNGGGTEWVSEVVALLTDRDLVRRPSQLVAPACDRSGIWRGESVCPVLAPPGEAAHLAGTGQWRGPLYILADHRTGSASEDFIAWLQQNGVAVVIGERTAGAGCGYVDGGGRITLQAAPFDVMAPNCARFLNDGTNEIEGIKPDAEIPMDATDPDRRATALAAALSRPWSHR